MKLTELLQPSNELLLESFKDVERIYYEKLEEDREKGGRAPSEDQLFREYISPILRRLNQFYNIRGNTVIDVYKDIVRQKLIPKSYELSILYNTGEVIKILRNGSQSTPETFALILKLAMEEIFNARSQKEKENEYDVVFKSGSVIVFKPESKEASCKLGKGTKWCTAGLENNYFDTYKRGGDLYYIHLNSLNRKIAIFRHKTGSVEAFNDKDDNIPLENVTLTLKKVGVDPNELYNKLDIKISQKRGYTMEDIEILDHMNVDDFLESLKENGVEEFSGDMTPWNAFYLYGQVLSQELSFPRDFVEFHLTVVNRYSRHVREYSKIDGYLLEVILEPTLEDKIIKLKEMNNIIPFNSYRPLYIIKQAQLYYSNSANSTRMHIENFLDELEEKYRVNIRLDNPTTGFAVLMELIEMI